MENLPLYTHDKQKFSVITPTKAPYARIKFMKLAN